MQLLRIYQMINSSSFLSIYFTINKKQAFMSSVNSQRMILIPLGEVSIVNKRDMQAKSLLLETDLHFRITYQ